MLTEEKRLQDRKEEIGRQLKEICNDPSTINAFKQVLKYDPAIIAALQKDLKIGSGN